MNCTALNLKNLTTLWRLASEAYQGYGQSEPVHRAHIPNSAWPNKVWVDLEASEDHMDQVLAELESHPGWVYSRVKPQNSTIPRQLQLASEQTGMSLGLSSPFPHSSRVTLEAVTTEDQAALWSQAFEDSFGYQIPDWVVFQIRNWAHSYLVMTEGELAGTVMHFKTGEVSGIHCLGIIPAKRRLGIAREAMHLILNKALESGSKWAMLQASEKAKELYLQMGFLYDFTWQNLRRID
ncbi:GNAT family N-acetyltransferase [bacterium SCSIO 12741]|nr:GNAT family N-acetyltransferase [bacterium SCSIO 12741]